MKALSIKQPWASLICTPREENPQLGIKDIENRTWRTHFRGRVYIHASAKSAGEISNLLSPEQSKSISDIDVMLNIVRKNIPFSAIIGEVDIIDCVINAPSIWAEQSDLSEGAVFKPIYNWVLANAKLYDKPILNVKGKLSFWETDYVHCENCNKPFHCDEMTSNDEAQWFCNSCVEDAKK